MNSSIFDIEDYWLNDELFIMHIQSTNNVYVPLVDKPRLLMNRILTMMNDYITEFNKKPQILILCETLCYDIANSPMFDPINMKNSLNESCWGTFYDMYVYVHYKESNKIIFNDDSIIDLDNFIKVYYRNKKINSL